MPQKEPPPSDYQIMEARWVPPPFAFYVLAGIVLASTFAAVIIAVLTSFDAPLGVLAALGASLLGVLIGAVFLVHGIEARRRFVYIKLQDALDAAEEFERAVSVQPPIASEPAPSEDRKVQADRIMDFLYEVENKLCDTGAYADAAIVREARRRIFLLRGRVES